MTNPTCTIDGCVKPTRSAKAQWCKMHYHRWYRHGSPDITATHAPVTASLGRRYRTLTIHSHPLAHANGKVYEHRAVLFDHLGVGPHPCHWCGTSVDWLPKGDPFELQVDHINADGADNRVENLVPSCRSCNTARGGQARANALKAAGWWSHNDTIAHLRNGGRALRVEDRRSA